MSSLGQTCGLFSLKFWSAQASGLTDRAFPVLPESETAPTALAVGAVSHVAFGPYVVFDRVGWFAIAWLLSVCMVLFS